ncbi:MAG: aldose 1-epimerase family protein [Candidatus Cryptobacteroides sp.]
MTLKNESLTIEVSLHGAELTGIRKDTTEYLWQADPAFWKRHSPVLFPIVGSVWNGCYMVNGKEYQLGQHGFARDMDFTLMEHTDDSILFSLSSDETTLAKYPWPFRLEIGYRLRGNEIDVLWKVENTGEEDMYFQIGAHPAFNYPFYDASAVRRGYFSFDRSDNLECIRIVEKGCVDACTKYPLVLDGDGLYPLERDTFDVIDTLMLQDSQLRKVTLHAPDKKPWLSLSFDAPVVGLWSPPCKNAPFICIEPWYGRCDRAGYKGEFKDRDWMNRLAPSETFAASYTITIY